jgi:glycosyltransferase involved in cell wall biosynthesis
MRSSSLGVIASTGWDSFTMSSVEMMSSGLPLIVSNLQGLAETIENGKNGYTITPGDYEGLRDCIKDLVGSDELRNSFSVASRRRAVDLFSKDIQVIEISKIITKFTEFASRV